MTYIFLRGSWAGSGRGFLAVADFLLGDPDSPPLVEVTPALLLVDETPEGVALVTGVPPASPPVLSFSLHGGHRHSMPRSSIELPAGEQKGKEVVTELKRKSLPDKTNKRKTCVEEMIWRRKEETPIMWVRLHNSLVTYGN